MASATDIITYIGVPLAVLGVLPILYTFTLAILTSSRIRRSLIHHGLKPTTSSRPHDGFSIRSSPMSSLTEIELPRYTIAPLDRHLEDYWKIKDSGYLSSEERRNLLVRAESTLSMVEEGRVTGFLKGGSWRAFHWRKIIVGKKLYRIQYEDELCEPPAEIDFSELIHFLLDWGAVPDPMGWEKLRSGGLWTPTGTVLLRKPEDSSGDIKRHIDWVLRTSVPDDSDGVLTLSVRWRQEFDDDGPARNSASLPPGWGRLFEPGFDSEEVIEDDNNAHKSLRTRLKELKSKAEKLHDCDSFRFRAEDNRIFKAFAEQDKIETGLVRVLFDSSEQVQSSQWFTAGLAAVLNERGQDAALWGYEVPESVSTTATKASVPCGVLVVLDLLSATDAPEWSSELGPILNGYNTFQNPASKFHARNMNRMAAEKLEKNMTPELARIHKTNREAQERREMMDDMQRENRERIERDEKRFKEAIASPRMGHRAVAEACLQWLINKSNVPNTFTIETVAEAVLYILMIDEWDDGLGESIVQVLREWIDWSNAGGMKRGQVEMIGRKKVEFCYTACLVAVVAEVAARPKKAGADMLECLKAWRKVRIG